MTVSKIRFSLFFLSASFLIFAGLMIAHKVFVVPLMQPRWFVNLGEKTTHIIDFFQYYQASQLALSEFSLKVYDPYVQKAWTDDLIKPLTCDKIFFNQQPPFSYVLLMPLALLPPNLGYISWCVVQAVFGLAALGRLAGLGPLTERDRGIFLIAVLASFPAYSCFFHGNTAFFLVGFLSLYVCFLYERKDMLAGVMLALSTFKPQYLLPMLLPSLVMKRWQVVAAFAVTEALLLVSACPVVGIENVIGYPLIVHNAESNPVFFGVKPEMMVSARGLFAQFLSIAESLSASALLMLFGLAPMYFMWLKTLANSSVDGLRRAWSVTIAFAVFASPHAHVFDGLLVAMAAALTLPTLSLTELRRLDVGHGIWCALLILLPFSWWIMNFALGYAAAPAAFFFPYVSMLLVISTFNWFTKKKCI